MRPRVWGDNRDVVVEISLDYQSFEWLVNQLEYPSRMTQDGAVVELRRLLSEIEAERGHL